MHNLKYYRSKANLTQSELADKVGVSSRYISMLECGRVPGMITATKIAIELKQKIEEIFFTDSSNNSFDVKHQ